MSNRLFVSIALSALAAAACSAPPGGDSSSATEEALRICPPGVVSPCPPPPPPTITFPSTWGRTAAGTRPSEVLRETLQLNADNSYSLTETSGPSCVAGQVCPQYVTIYHHTEGTFAVSGLEIDLRPTLSDPNLPEVFDIQSIPVPLPLQGTAADAPAAGDGSLIVSRPVWLHAKENGVDIRLTREATTPIPPCPLGRVCAQ